MVELKLNVIVVGNANVGKTSLIRRYADHKFETSYIITAGSDVTRKDDVLIKVGPVDINTTLILYDIGGQEHFHNRVEKYAPLCRVFIICYDITNYESFLKIQDWYTLIGKSLSNRTDWQKNVIFVGTKADLAVPYHLAPDGTLDPVTTGTCNFEREQQQQVSVNYLEQACQFFNCKQAIETSAKNGNNIDALFQTVAKLGIADVAEKDFSAFLQMGCSLTDLQNLKI